MLGPAKREAVATLGAKYDFRMATFRGQVDSNGKVGMLLEQRFTPAFAFMVGGEIDHAKVSATAQCSFRFSIADLPYPELVSVRGWYYDRVIDNVSLPAGRFKEI